MKLLLDTHIWLWSRLEPAKLSASAADAISDAGNELWLSPISAWELVALCRKDRVRLQTPVMEWLAATWRSGGYTEAPLSMAVIAATGRIQLDHRDPMDWLLAATARHYRLTLVTVDARLLAGTGFSTLAPATL